MTAVGSRGVSVAIGALGLLFVLTGGWAGVDSHSFSRTLADFGPENGHLVHDFGAASFAIGAGLLLAVRRVAWRAPVLVVATLWNGLHAISHLVDLEHAESRAVGIGEAALLVAGTLLLGALALASREEA